MSIPSRLKTWAGGGGDLATLVSATTAYVPDKQNGFYVSGSATITSLSAPKYTRGRLVRFVGSTSAAVVFTNTTGSTTDGQMDLGGSNITLSAKDVLTLWLNENGVWQLVAVRYNNAVSNSLASATTTVVPDTGDFFVVTGTASITSLTGTTTGRIRRVAFIGGTSASVTFTNTQSPSSGQMYLQGANLLLMEQDVLVLLLQTDGSWIIESTTIA